MSRIYYRGAKAALVCFGKEMIVERGFGGHVSFGFLFLQI
jgi:hypothetical protein